MLLLIAVLAFVIMVIFSYIGLGGYISERDAVALRLKALDNQKEAGAVIQEEMSLSLKDRLVSPIFEAISGFMSNLVPSAALESLEKKLISANGFHGLSAAQFFGLAAVLGMLLAVLTWELLMITKQPSNKIMAYCLIAFLLGIILPFVLLEQKIVRRKANLMHELPDVLDLLTVSVEAGLGFDGALIKLSEKMKGEMVDEFTRMLQEMRIGVPRREALRSLAKRCNTQDVNLFTGALIQADQLGVSIAKVLRIQSVEMRDKRRQRAEEQAMKAPVKMLFPLVFFIFPAILIVLLGPAVLQIIGMMSDK